MIDYIAVITGIMQALFHLLIVRKAIEVLLGESKKGKVRYILWCGFLVFSFLGIVKPEFKGAILLLGNLVFITVISVVTRTAPFKIKLFFSIIIVAVWSLEEVLIVFLVQLVKIDKIVSGQLLVFLTQLIMLLIVVFLERTRREKYLRDISIKGFLLLAWIPVVSIYIIGVITRIAQAHKSYDGFASCVSALLLLTNYIIFELYELINKDLQIQSNNKLFVQQIEMCERQTSEQESMYNELRRYRHDMKNHLTSLRGLIESGDNSVAKKYVERLLSDVVMHKNGEIAQTGNIVIDSLVNSKYAIAVDSGISFNANLFIPNKMMFKNEHLVIILGNLLDNAIEACQYRKEESKYIKLDMSYEKNMLHICVKNSGSGIKHKVIDGLIQTTKKDRVNHGMGLMSVKKAAQVYEGELLLKDKEQEFVAMVILYEV
ncbi:MAG: GHKL domain-containing protein [Pseudobutyrivibrio sp.]|nr:GHKL domain-containing protein [Pseudobutyrivibrio sp.]